MQELPRERTAIAATALGAIRGSIDVTTQYVKERQAFGQAIGQFQNTRFVLAQAKIDELATAAFYNQNLELYMQGKLDVETAAALKSFSTDMQSLNGTKKDFSGNGTHVVKYNLFTIEK
jgi:long-chain-acyl-CoA dehydrogenase